VSGDHGSNSVSMHTKSKDTEYSEEKEEQHDIKMYRGKKERKYK
jgi:hypothetical protein